MCEWWNHNVFQGATSEHSVQLQRIISRCKCQFFYAHYGEVDSNTLPDIPIPPVSNTNQKLDLKLKYCNYIQV